MIDDARTVSAMSTKLRTLTDREAKRAVEDETCPVCDSDLQLSPFDGTVNCENPVCEWDGWSYEYVAKTA